MSTECATDTAMLESIQHNLIHRQPKQILAMPVRTRSGRTEMVYKHALAPFEPPNTLHVSRPA